MDLWHVLEARHSVRQFDPAVEVSPETVERILRAAVWAPSAGNRQRLAGGDFRLRDRA